VRSRPQNTSGPEGPAQPKSMGAHLSEVMNAEVTNSEEGGFSRRRVVKGVAWSVPVIVTAIAAPAAAASGISATATVVGAGSAVAFVSSGGTGAGTNRTGTGPTAFQIQNTGSAITGTITGTVSITPVGTVDAGIGISSVAPAALASSAYTASHAYNATFTYTAGIAAGQALNFPIQFQYQALNPGPKKGAGYSYQLTITLTLPDATTRSLAATPTITF